MRIGASLAVAGIMGLAIAQPQFGGDYARKVAQKASAISNAVDAAPMASRACVTGKPLLNSAFAPIEDVLSVSPLGGVTAPGEVRPAPFIRINTKTLDANSLTRQDTAALAPARADIVALERHVDRDSYGRAQSTSWTVHLQICEKVRLRYSGISQLADDVLNAAGPIIEFTELGSADHIARQTQIRLREGDVIGISTGFDVALHDLRAAPVQVARPERYRINPFDRGSAIGAPSALIKAISPDQTRTRCALDLLPEGLQGAWSALLGDAWGLRGAKGNDRCRTALLDIPNTAQGVWYTDSAHNGATSSVSAIALAPDSIDPQKQILALHGRVPSFAPDLVAGLAPHADEERKKATKSFLVFDTADTGANINQPFAAIRETGVYCYEGLRAGFVGPLLDGVMLLSVRENDQGTRTIALEASGAAASCADLAKPWALSANATSFYR